MKIHSSMELAKILNRSVRTIQDRRSKGYMQEIKKIEGAVIYKHMGYYVWFNDKRIDSYISKEKLENPIWRDKDYLYEKYIVRDKTIDDIAEQLGIHRATIIYYLKLHSIKKINIKGFKT